MTTTIQKTGISPQTHSSKTSEAKSLLLQAVEFELMRINDSWERLAIIVASNPSLLDNSKLKKICEFIPLSEKKNLKLGNL